MTGNELRQLRISLDLTNRQVANFVGVSPHTLWRWETRRDEEADMTPIARALLTTALELKKRGLPTNVRNIFITGQRDILDAIVALVTLRDSVPAQPTT